MSEKLELGISKESLKHINDMAQLCQTATYHLKAAAIDIQKLMDIENGIDSDILTIEHLGLIHPELSEEGCYGLLEFAKSKTITFKSCYGNGSIIYPMWLKETAEFI